MSERLEYHALREEGLRQLERLAGEAWTDFNVHDPGITILEQVCYALSDFGYRLGHDLPDLLASGGSDPAAGLFSAAEVLTTRPVTRADLRRLVLDVQGVKNAWVEPVLEPRPELWYHPGRRDLVAKPEGLSTEPLRPRGLLDVTIEKSDLVEVPSATLRRDVARRLHANRNLCEDYASVRILDPQDVAVKASIEVEATDDPEGVLAKVLDALATHVSPEVAFHGLEEMLARGHSVDEVFEGPALEHGFLDDESLARLERKSHLHASDLVHALMDVEGVRAIRDLELVSEGVRSAWTLELDPERAPRLDLRATVVTLERGRLALPVDRRGAELRYQTERAERFARGPLAREERDRPVPGGRDRRVGRYESILHQFPRTYGVGEAGLPSSAPPARRAWAKQLQAYLLLHDQLLANQFAQLELAPKLFDFGEPLERSYAGRPVEDEGLRLETLRGEPDAHGSRVQELVEAEDAPDRARRENRFLSHLLARFAEELSDYALTGVAGDGSAATAARRIENKRSFLQRFPWLSSARGTGVDYLRATKPGAPPPVSGLEQRIRHKLGLGEVEPSFFVVEHVLLLPIEEDLTPPEHEGLRDVPLLSASRSADPYSLQLTFVFPDWPDRFAEPGWWDFVERTLHEETPAHLTPWLARMAKTEFESFRAAYGDWLRARRRTWEGGTAG